MLIWFWLKSTSLSITRKVPGCAKNSQINIHAVPCSQRSRRPLGVFGIPGVMLTSWQGTKAMYKLFFITSYHSWIVSVYMQYSFPFLTLRIIFGYSKATAFLLSFLQVSCQQIVCITSYQSLSWLAVSSFLVSLGPYTGSNKEQYCWRRNRARQREANPTLHTIYVFLLLYRMCHLAIITISSKDHWLRAFNLAGVRISLI